MARKNMLDTFSRGGYPGNHFVNPAYAEPTGLAYKAQDGKQTVTVLRIVPELDETGQPVPMFINDPETGSVIPSYWHLRARAWRAMGNPSLTFFVENPLVDEEEFDPHSNPAALIAKSVCERIKNQTAPATWIALQKARILPKQFTLQRMGVSQALVYQRYDICEPPKGAAVDDKIQVVAFSDAASATLVTALCQSYQAGMEGYANSLDPTEFVQALQYGDVIGLTSQDAKFACFTPNTIDPDQALGLIQQHSRVGASIGGRRVQPVSDQRGGGADFAGYNMKLYADYRGQSAWFDEGSASFIASKIQPWSKALVFPTVEQQVHLLCKSVPYDVLAYSWSDYSSWIPAADSASYRAAHGSTSVAMGGYGVPQAQQPAQYDNMAAEGYENEPYYEPLPDDQHAAQYDDPVYADDAGYVEGQEDMNLVEQAFAHQPVQQPAQFRPQPAQFRPQPVVTTANTAPMVNAALGQTSIRGTPAPASQRVPPAGVRGASQPPRPASAQPAAAQPAVRPAAQPAARPGAQPAARPAVQPAARPAAPPAPAGQRPARQPVPAQAPPAQPAQPTRPARPSR